MSNSYDFFLVLKNELTSKKNHEKYGEKQLTIYSNRLFGQKRKVQTKNKY